MCTIGKLKHPGSQELLQKSTQILTTSQIMYQYLENQRCNKNHHHDSVAGGYKTNMVHGGVYLNILNSILPCLANESPELWKPAKGLVNSPFQVPT